MNNLLTLGNTTALITVAIAAILDWRTRRVSNWLWVLPGIIGLWLNIHSPISTYLLIALSTLAAIVQWKFGHMGGADAKGLIILSLLLGPLGAWSSAAIALLMWLPVLWVPSERLKTIPFMVPLLGGVFFVVVYRAILH